MIDTKFGEGTFTAKIEPEAMKHIISMTNAPVYVKHDAIAGCLYMLRDSFTVNTDGRELVDTFNAGEVFIFDGEVYVSTEDRAMLAESIIKKLKNEMIPATEWEKRGLKWEKIA